MSGHDTETVLLTLGALMFLVNLAAALVWLFAEPLAIRVAQRRDRRLARQERRLQTGYESPQEPPQDLPQVDPGPAPGARAEERVARLEVDPENMPTWKTYSPVSGRPPLSCHCHPDRTLEPGQQVLWWPAPHSGGGVRIFCEDGVQRTDQS